MCYCPTGFFFFFFKRNVIFSVCCSTYLPVMTRIRANKDKVSLDSLMKYVFSLNKNAFNCESYNLLIFGLFQVLIYSPTFFKYVHESWLDGHGRYPSTGFLSLLLALHICDEVSQTCPVRFSHFSYLCNKGS